MKQIIASLTSCSSQLLANYSAMSMLEFLIALGLFGGISTAIVKTTTYMNASNKKFSQDFEKIAKMNEIDRALNDHNSCVATLAGTPIGNSISLPSGTNYVSLPSIIMMISGTPSVIATAGTSYGGTTTGQLILSGMAIRRASAAPFVLVPISGTPLYAGNAIVTFNFTKPTDSKTTGSLGNGSAYIDRTIPVLTDTSATNGTIRDCYFTVQDAYYKTFCKALGATYDENSSKCRSMYIDSSSGSPAVSATGAVSVNGSLTVAGNINIGNTVLYYTPTPDFINTSGNIVISNGNITTALGGVVTSNGYISANGNIFTTGSGKIFTNPSGANGNIYTGGAGNICSGGKIYTSGSSNHIYTSGGHIYTTGNGSIYTQGTGNIYTTGNGNITSANNINAKRLIVNTSSTVNVISDSSGYISLSPNIGTTPSYTIGRVATENWVYNALISGFSNGDKQAIINNIMIPYSATPSNGLNAIKNAVAQHINAATTTYGTNASCSGYMVGLDYDSNTHQYTAKCKSAVSPVGNCDVGQFIKSIDNNGNITCSSLSKEQRFFFGGMYQASGSSDCNNTRGNYTNPITSDWSCPPGYNDALILNSGSDCPLHLCYYDLWSGPPPSTFYDFGGVYGYINAAPYNNPLTNTWGCPPGGFNAKQILGTQYWDYALYFCYRGPYSTYPNPSSPYEFGGMFGVRSDGGINYNPFSKGQGCPGTNFTMNQVFGTSGADYPMYLCWRPL